MHTRRLFLKSSALAMFGVGSTPLWLSRAVYANSAPVPRRKVLIVIFQRGAVDGLNVVVPHGDPNYYALRPSIAVPRPDGTEDGAIDLDGHFGLHPNLRALKPLWDQKQLAIVEAVGSPDPTRSHFDAQDYMESGTPGRKGTLDGWLNRALPVGEKISPVRAVSLSAELPRTLRGPAQVVSIGDLKDFRVQQASYANTFESMYGTTTDQFFNGAGKDTFDAMRMIQKLEQGSYRPQNGARYPNGRLGQSLQQIGRLIKAEVGLEVAFTDVGGWDTHVNEMGPRASIGQLPNLLRNFGDCLGAFARDMGDRMEDIALITMSEFGRTAKENGDRGTDHGHANVMFAMGGGVEGGKVYGQWPGLEKEQLYEGRDLALTTDFRDVLSEVVQKQLGNGRINTIFPGYSPVTRSNLMKA